MEENVIQFNNDKCIRESKKCHVYEKDYFWNPATCSCKNGKYLASIMDNSVIVFNEVIELYDETIKTISTSFNQKKGT